MGGMKFEYDENGAKFYYFIVSFYAMIIIPCTYYFWPKVEKKKDYHAEDLSTFEPCRLKIKHLNRDEPRKKFYRKLTKFILIVGWIIFIIIAYKTSQIEIEHKEYDPFAILGIDRETSDKEIRKRYRELSKTMHPDKGGDEDMFKELTKAYKALTDEEARENWAKYGNPDGPGVTQFGIALPKWIVDGKNSYLVLAAYVLVFMIIMPTIVGLWWYKSIKYTGDQLLMKTSELYRHFVLKQSKISVKRATMILSASYEFDKSSNSEIVVRPDQAQQMIRLVKDLQEKCKEPPFSFPYSVRARALIKAHLSRADLNSDTLVLDKNVVIRKCPFLLNEMLSIIFDIVSYINAYGAPGGVHSPQLLTVESVIKLSQLIVQGVEEKQDGKYSTSLHQLPHMEENHLRHFVTKRKRNITTIKQFVGLGESERRSLLKNMTDEQYDDVMRACATYPKMSMEVNVNVFDDEDEQTITEGALVTVQVKLTRQSLEVDFGKNKLEEDKPVDEKAAEETVKEKTPAKPVSNRYKPKKSSKAAKKNTKPAKGKPKTAVDPKAPADPKETAAKQEEEDGSDIESGSENQDGEAGHSDGGELNEDEKTNDEESESEEEEESEPKSRKKVATKKQTLKKKSSSSASAEEKVENVGEQSGDSSHEKEDFFEKFQKIQKKREKLETKTKTSHRVYCPFYPEIKQECWWLYVGYNNKNIVSKVIYICNLKDTQELELKFLAPWKPGNYTYTVFLRSDSYMDFDVYQNINFTVYPAKKIEEHPQWNFADEENENQNEEELDDEFATESENDE